MGGAMERVESRACHGGVQEVWSHHSKALDCQMRFGVYLPPGIEQTRAPVLYWLSGLTCTEQNFITKAHAQQAAAKHGIIIVAPDTSPRGEGVADDPEYDLGCGAGFYLNAAQAPWASHYRMYEYVVEELPALVEGTFAATSQRSIFGHSMGGHGALVIALRNPGRYRSVSAFAPICAPSQVPWGHKAFGAYLGDDQSQWASWDAAELIAGDLDERLTLLIDQGTSDPFLESQLKPELLQAACEKVGHPLSLRMRQGYDHSYYFIASFMDEHIAHHAQALRGS